ncbi:MAG: hypothetical protein KDE21_04670 [Novosphingobium sp.]|nr:hypothetical protein [Novosphingobium sp.]
MNGGITGAEGFSSHPVWQALSAYTIGPEGAELTFEQRLARENGWSAAEAARVLEEYKRFCFLATTAGHPVTPSEAVDQAWHLHLAYSRDYWQRFCPNVLGRELHHGPTAGGAAQRDKHFEQYALTLRSYEEAFGTPPEDIWPASYKRFYEDSRARRVNPRDYILLPRRRAYALMIVILCVVFGLLVDNWLR